MEQPAFPVLVETDSAIFGIQDRARLEQFVGIWPAKAAPGLCKIIRIFDSRNREFGISSLKLGRMPFWKRLRTPSPVEELEFSQIRQDVPLDEVVEKIALHFRENSKLWEGGDIDTDQAAAAVLKADSVESAINIAMFGPQSKE